ncbi:hypothetical protein NGTWS0302_00250 [Mycolicibacterium cyprinidarum]|uniref:Uncharacterized protein n=1 Tax=Mycolicibacterium cyprinidarum TaxID=2860311 RepID=A0ABQ4VDR4_9MYCO|nr:hypothetical protein NGTWS0302_00250 [Mycolicibacterium sp. NGTWS0302]GJF16177.1 hypothetical protein NGTWS1702_20670 [Mycolicibacterium sp. NGTWSNA01]
MVLVVLVAAVRCSSTGAVMAARAETRRWPVLAVWVAAAAMWGCCRYLAVVVTAVPVATALPVVLVVLAVLVVTAHGF